MKREKKGKKGTKKVFVAHLPIYSTKICGQYQAETAISNFCFTLFALQPVETLLSLGPGDVWATGRFA